jgi:hypothetical protein
MDNNHKKFAWDYFEGIYKGLFQNKETFSKEIIEEMQQEFQKMSLEYKNWLEERKKQNDTGTISDGIENQ